MGICVGFGGDKALRVFINPGHSPDGNPDPGACGNGLRECDIAAAVSEACAGYLRSAGVEVTDVYQSDDLAAVTRLSDVSRADIFISVHCNSAASPLARGTETLVYGTGGRAERLADCLQRQVIRGLGTADRGLKERPDLWVLAATRMPAALVEMAFISNHDDALLLKWRQDDFARAIARGVTDYQWLIKGGR